MLKNGGGSEPSEGKVVSSVVGSKDPVGRLSISVLKSSCGLVNRVTCSLTYGMGDGRFMAEDPKLMLENCNGPVHGSESVLRSRVNVEQQDMS